MQLVRIERMDERLASGGKRLGLWFGLIGAPAAWFVQLIVSYPLVTIASSTGRRWPLHASTLAFLGIAGLAGIIAAVEWRRPGRTDDELALQRTRFMGLVGLLTSALFFLLIAAQGVPSFIFDPSET